MIRKLIEEIIEKYYRESDEYYSRYREDEDGNDFGMDEEIKSALEKADSSTKPIILDTLNGDIDYTCPLCGKNVISDAESRNNYCGECGCKFDWSEIDASTKSKSQRI